MNALPTGNPQTAAASPRAAAGGIAAAATDLGGQLWRALVVGASVVLGAGTAVGIVLFPLLQALPNDAFPHYGSGLLAALGAGMVALYLHGRFLDPRGSEPFARDGRLQAARLQSLLAAAFGAKLAGLVLGVCALRLSDAKFAATATFAITYAGAALLCQLATAMSLARAVPRRSQPAGPTVSAPADNKREGGGQ